MTLRTGSALIGLLCWYSAAVVHAQAAQPAPVLSGSESTVTVITSAPIYVTTRPSPRLAPMRVAPPGTVLEWTGREEAGWLQVQFDDPQWGERTGWVEKTRVQITTTPRPPFQPGQSGRAGGVPQRTAAAEALQPRAVPAKNAIPLERVYVAIGGGYQAGVDGFTDASTFTEYLESAKLDADYQLKDGPAIEGSGAVRLWRTLAVSVGFSRFSKSGAGELSIEVPHPFFFDRTRPGGPYSFGGITHEERVVRVEATVLAPVGKRVVVMAGAGPAFVHVTQDIVSSAQWSESGYPYDAPVVIQGVTTSRESGSKVGFAGGADVGFYFSRNVGIGAAVRFVRAKVPVNDRLEVDAGGLQVGVGLRLKVGSR